MGRPYEEIIQVLKQAGVDTGAEREALGYYFSGGMERTDFDLVATLSLPSPATQAIVVPSFISPTYLTTLNQLIPDFRPAFKSLADMCAVDSEGRPAGTGLFYSPSTNMYLRLQEEGFGRKRFHFLFSLDATNWKQFKERWQDAVRKELQGKVLQHLPELIGDADITELNPVIPLDQLPDLQEIMANYQRNIQKQIERIKRGLEQVFYGSAPKFVVLLVGKPGTGKTFLAAALLRWAAEHLQLTGVKVSADQFVKAMDDVVRYVPNPVILVEDVEGLAVERREHAISVTTLMLLDKLGGVTAWQRKWALIMTTNLPQIMDKAVLRPVRVDELVIMEPIPPTLAIQVIRFWLRRLGVDDTITIKPNEVDELTYAECSLVAERIANSLALNHQVTVADIMTEVRQWRRIHKADYLS